MKSVAQTAAAGCSISLYLSCESKSIILMVTVGHENIICKVCIIQHKIFD